jgi:hypothetical protein
MDVSVEADLEPSAVQHPDIFQTQVIGMTAIGRESVVPNGDA